MALTEEQRERIRKNKERALQIQKERRELKEKRESKNTNNDNNKRSNNNNNTNIQENSTPSKKHKTTVSTITTSQPPSTITTTTTSTTGAEDRFHSNAPLEDFEEGASELVSKKEAMSMYCLPEGTMAVCSYEEKQNPHNPLFKPMKLYKRSEIRYRAHKRHEGLEGLVNERNKRRKRKLDKDMEEARDIFK